MKVPTTPPSPRGMAAARTALAALACAAAASGAQAACTLSLAPATLDFGNRPVASLPAADLPGWRLLGQRLSTVTGVCDAPQTRLRLRFINVQAGSASGLLLLPARPASARAGALRMRAQEARVGNATVLVSIEGSSAAPSATRDIAEPGAVLVLNLAQPLAANTAFSVQLAMTGLLPNGFTPVQQTTYAASPSVELLP